MLKRLHGSPSLISTTKEIDKASSTVPFHLLSFPLRIVNKSLVVNVKIERDLMGRPYLSVWLELMLKSKVMDTDSIMYQEIDALISSALSFPSSIDNWNTSYSNLQLFGLAMYSVASETTHTLFRGSFLFRYNFCFMNILYS